MAPLSRGNITDLTELKAKTQFAANKAQYGDKIRERRIACGINQPQLARVLGVSKNTISNWEAGRSRPDLNQLVLLCETLKTTVPWFLGAPDRLSDLTKEELQHLKNYRFLSASNKQAVDRLIDAMLDIEDQDLHVRCKNGFLRIHRNGNKTAAGVIGNNLSDYQPGEYLYVRTSRAACMADEIITVTGDSMALNTIKGTMAVIFPLITFPYISRILGVDNIGKYNFANSIVSYFVLLAGLGINTYAIREGARIREQQKDFKIFADEMFSINLISTVFSYGLFVLLLLIVPKFQTYMSLLIILSLQIIFKTIGIEWLYSIYEDYSYITLVSIVFQIVSLVLMFTLVKTQDDVNWYAMATVLSAAGCNVAYFIHAKRYCRVNWAPKIDWKRHIKPILILFSMAIAVTIYVNSDITILGFFCDDKTVGIYSVSTKIYIIVKTILSSILIVSIPKLSAVLNKQDIKEFHNIADDIYKMLLSIVIPAIVGIILLRRQIVLLISGPDYISATSSLMLLSIALFFCMGAWFWGQCILVPLRMENEVLKVTIISAILNIVLNLILIPTWKENAAAFTTILSEGLSFLWCMFVGQKKVKIQGNVKIIIKILIGCCGIVGTVYLMRVLFKNFAAFIISSIIASIIVYCLLEIVVKNETLKKLLGTIPHKEKTAKSQRTIR